MKALFQKTKKGVISVALIVILAIVAIVGILAASVIGTYNSLATSREAVTSKAADIDTVLQRRADLIPNLVNTVKGFTQHEDEVIEKITTAREHLVNAQSLEEKSAANAELTSGLNALMVIVENYPDLKSSENFIALQDELSGTENRIATARHDYNEVAKTYNTKIQTFPSNIIAGMFNFEKAAYFEADDSAKEVPVVDFSK
ncbi:MAG: LemA family protein [Candidatus Saccharibacteria bacterium]|nr:LemA family protein [Candidatus Saccharibacteria bacterium]